MSDNQRILSALSQLHKRIEAEHYRHLRQIDQLTRFHFASTTRLYQELAALKRLVKDSPQVPVVAQADTENP
jgi:hypothetical protein